MSKYGATKEKILELVAQGNNNLSKISSTLELSPSTVSKHLHDLEKEGRIAAQDNPHFKKWKFYSVGGARKREQYSGRKDNVIGRGTMVAVAAFILLVISAAYAYSRSSGAAQIPIRITDPPEVPAGTQALYINYSSLEAEVGNGGRFTWIAVNSSGRLDLMGLINYTQLIGELDIAPSTTIRRIAFNITSSSITIDNVTYAVHLLGKQVMANVENGNVLDRSSGVLLDLSPIVTPDYTQNSTTFTMLPFLMAIAAHSQNGQVAPMTDRSQAPYPLEPYYRSMFSGIGLNLTITNVTLLSEGNETALNITISNTGKSSIGIVGMVLPYENMPMPFSNNLGMPWAIKEGIRQMNCSAYLNGPGGPTAVRWCQQSNSSVVINESAVRRIMPYLENDFLDANLPAPVSHIAIFNRNAQPNPDPEFMLAHPPAINFIVNADGTLSIPGPQMGAHIGASEYVLNADSSVTLTYKGRLGNDLSTLNSSIHNISIITDRGIAQGSITAG